jgi:hypothetical protein
MSVVVETLIFCDGGDEGLPCPMDGPYGSGDGRSRSAGSQRKGYRSDGWRYIGGKDYCPDCVKARAPDRGRKE